MQLYIALAILIRGAQNATVTNITYFKLDLNIFTSSTITFFAFTAHVRPVSVRRVHPPVFNLCLGVRRRSMCSPFSPSCKTRNFAA